MKTYHTCPLICSLWVISFSNLWNKENPLMFCSQIKGKCKSLLKPISSTLTGIFALFTGSLSEVAAGDSSKFLQIKSNCYINRKWWNCPKRLRQFRNRGVVNTMSNKWKETSSILPICIGNNIPESKSHLIN